MRQAEELARVGPAAKAQSDRKDWSAWLGRYRARLQQEADAGASPVTRVDLMNSTNPRCCCLFLGSTIPRVVVALWQLLPQRPA